MRRSLSNVLAISVTIAFALTGAVPASAATLSTDVGACPSEQSVMPSTSSSAVNGYLCAQEDHSGDQSIGADKTHSWTQNTNVMYYPQYNCSDTTSSSVTVALAAIFGSATYTATNWLAASLTEDNTRHWSAALLWTLGAGTVTGFNNGCDVSDEVWSNPPQILTVDSMSVTGMPDNNTLTAGQKYTFIATVKPQSATPTVALLLDGVGVAEGSVVNGQATISWTPPVEGSHTLAFAFQGNSTNTGGETTPIRVSIVNGVSTTLNSMTPIAGSATNSATTNVSVTPTTTAANVVILDIDALDSTGSPTKVGKGVLSNGVANVTTTPVAPGGSTHRYVAIVVNSAGATIGQSVPFSWKTVIGTSIDLTGISASPVAGVPYTLSATVSPRENGYIYLYDNGVKVSGTDTSSSPDMYPGEGDTVTYPSLAWTPTSSGSHSLVAKFVPNDSWVLGSQSTSQAVNVASGVVLTISTVTKPTSGSPIASITVSPTTWTGTISLTNNGGAVLSSGTAVNGKLSLSFKPPSASCNCVYLIASTPVPNSTPNIALSNKYKYIFGPQPLSSIGVDKGVSIDERMGVALKQAGLSPAAKRPAPGHPGHGPGIAPAGAGVETGSTLVSQSLMVPKLGSRSLSSMCPAGSVLLHADSLTSGPLDAIDIQMSDTGATFVAPLQDAGHEMRTQLVCRQVEAALLQSAGYALGTARADVITLTAAGGTAFAGPGNDRASSTGATSALWGGLGDDSLMVKGADSSADGGVGRDRLVANGKIRALLVGGPGRDLLIGSTGPSVINAADGRGGDRVICRSASTRVTADRGDTITGPCAIITYAKSA